MLRISKILSIVAILSLSSSLFSKELDISNNDEYFNNLYEVLSEKGNGKVNIICDDCGIENNHPDLKYIFKDYDRLSNITYLKDGISVSYSKEIFVENMKHLYILNKDFKSSNSIRLKTRNLSNDYITLDGNKYLISELEELIKKYKENDVQVNKEISKNIKKIKINNFVEKEVDKYILKKDNKKDVVDSKIDVALDSISFHYEFVIASSTNSKDVDRVLAKYNNFGNSIVKKDENSKYYMGVVIIENNKSINENLNEIKKIVKDAWLLKSFKIN